MTETFGDLVATYEQTCGACPTQYEGQLTDGRWFYFRYRHGTASLGIGATEDEACDYDGRASLNIGDGLAGFMDETEFKDVFLVLYRVWHWQAAR